MCVNTSIIFTCKLQGKIAVSGSNAATWQQAGSFTPDSSGVFVDFVYGDYDQTNSLLYVLVRHEDMIDGTGSFFAFSHT